MAASKPTLRDVAAAAGVSPMTASNALRGKTGVKESTRARVLAAAKKLDYRINLTASMLKSGRSNIIHVIVNEFRLTVLFETHAGTEQRNRGTRAHAVHRTDALFRRRRRARADQQSVLRTIIRR